VLMETSHASSTSRSVMISDALRKYKIVVGYLIYVAMLVGVFLGKDRLLQCGLAVGGIAVLWVLEPIPYHVASFVPLVVFPLSNLIPGQGGGRALHERELHLTDTHLRSIPYKLARSSLFGENSRHPRRIGAPDPAFTCGPRRLYAEGKFVCFLRRGCGDVRTPSSDWLEWKDSGSPGPPI
ncbi:hypothetical protein HPB47_024091, partial [Ixodes persulcatus]